MPRRLVKEVRRGASNWGEPMIGLSHPAAGAAVLSPCGAYRYLLTRRLGAGDEVDVAVAVGRRKQQAVSLRAGSGGALLRHPDQIGQPHRNQPGPHRADVPVVMIQPRRQFAHLLHAVHPQQRDDDVERQD
jgi:hypothetical protein